MPRLLIIKTGDAFPEVVRGHGDFESLFQQVLGQAGFTATVFDPRQGSPLPDQADIDGLYITGSHSMVSEREPWSEALKPWLRDARANNVPMLGVCYGHQLMAAAFGGVSDFHPAGRESGTHQVTLTDAGQSDALLGTLPQRFPAQLTHAQSVLEVPSDVVVLAYNAHDPHQALRYGPRQWSVQFHPEFTTPVMRAYLERQREALREIGHDPQTLIENVITTPDASSLLVTFAKQTA
ncbi:glutamine amidotransferase [Marinimicrobium sp. ABcell2]|uniref:glutamine amidotransferase n=1 Tax=Marinimicrobium sp. ABcell2 TaxID=3069751 RepID=UPI0027B278AA|nr:glutamine amidotransferase [Marinimicrobium sp. ABcell2]MDQ2076921.1 glutamine amidotransferase [Marinimicrobium sp. ABcell2]